MTNNGSRKNSQLVSMIFRLITFFFSVALCLLVLEFGIRAVDHGKYCFYSSYNSRPIIESGPWGPRLACGFHDILYGYKMYSPGAPLVRWEVKIDKYGWREYQPKTVEKPADVKRLMVLGDSIMYGMTLNYKDTHSSYLQHGLLLDYSANWEVLNRCVPSWAGWHELRYFQLDGYLWKPDVVTVNVCMNDFKPLSDDEIKSQIPVLSKANRIFGRWHLYNLVRIYFSGAADPREIEEFYHAFVSPQDCGVYKKDKGWYVRGEYDTAEKEAVYQKANKISFPRYEVLKRECDSRGCYLLVVVYPAAGQVSPRYWTSQKCGDAVLRARPIIEFCAFLESKKIPYLNLLDNFRAETNRVLFVDGLHLSEYGHKISARAVLSRLKEEGLVKADCEPFWE